MAGMKFIGGVIIFTTGITYLGGDDSFLITQEVFESPEASSSKYDFFYS
jgi:hypothetical protein